MTSETAGVAGWMISAPLIMFFLIVIWYALASDDFDDEGEDE